MFIFVTVCAERELDSVLRVLPPRLVALGTLNSCMLRLQGISAGRMLLDPVKRRFEPPYRMACGALSTVGSLRELSSMRIRPVTVRAFLKCQRFLEVPFFMTLRAFDHLMPAQKGILGFRMIVPFADTLNRDPLPAACVVAGLTALRETPLVRIGMAVAASRECKSGITRLMILSGGMAPLATYLNM